MKRGTKLILCVFVISLFVFVRRFWGRLELRGQITSNSSEDHLANSRFTNFRGAENQSKLKLLNHPPILKFPFFQTPCDSAMLGRRGLKAATYLCSRCGLLNIAPNTSFKSPIRRQIHGTQSPLGILDFLIGDTFQARLHKEIGKMLEDYDQHLIICYKEAVEAVCPLYSLFIN